MEKENANNVFFEQAPEPGAGVTFALISPDGMVLMQQRDDGNGRVIPYPNHWCIPGSS